MEYFQSFIDLISYLCAFAGGILGTIITTKWLNKEVILTKRFFTQRIAYSSNTPTWGDIKVLYNGDPCDNLHLVTVEIHNESNRSIEDIEVVFTVPERNIIYANSGEYKQNDIYTPLLLTTAYINYFMNVAERFKTINELDGVAKQQLDQEVDVVTRQKKYHIPVFNKNGVGVFSFLVNNLSNSDTSLLVSIIKKDVRLAPYQEEEERKEIQTKWVNILSLISFLVLSYAISKFSSSITTSVYLMIANLFICYYLSLALYKTMYWFKNFVN